MQKPVGTLSLKAVGWIVAAVIVGFVLAKLTHHAIAAAAIPGAALAIGYLLEIRSPGPEIGKPQPEPPSDPFSAPREYDM